MSRASASGSGWPANESMEVATLASKPAATWSVVEVGRWVDWLELGEYKKMFLENVIDGKELLELTEEDMIELGMSRLGHRKKLARRIAGLKLGSKKAFDSESDNDSEVGSEHSSASAASSSAASGRSAVSAQSGGSSASAASTTSVGGTVRHRREAVAFKVSYQEAMKIVTISNTGNHAAMLQSLQRHIKSELGHTMELSFRDAEGDQMALTKEGDLALAIAEAADKPYVRLEARRRHHRSHGHHHHESGSGSGSGGSGSHHRVVRSDEAAVLDQMLDAVLVIDTRGIVLFSNAAAQRMFGWERRALQGQNVRVLMPGEEAARHDGYLEAYLKTGRSELIGRGRKVTAMRRDGSAFPAWLSVSETKSRKRHTFTGTLQDLTGRESFVVNNLTGDRAADTAAVSSHFAFMDNLLDPAVVANERGLMMYANPAASRLFGHARDALVGQNVSMLMSRADGERHQSYVNRYLATGVPRVLGRTREVLGMCKDGTLVRLQLSLSEQKLGECKSIFVGTMRRLEGSTSSPALALADGGTATAAATSVLQQERDVIDRLPVAAIIINEAGLIQAFNQSAQQLLGYSLVEVVGKNVKILTTGDDRANHDRYMRAYLDSGVPKIIGTGRDVVAQRRDGSLVSVRLAVTVRTDAENKRIFTGILQPIVSAEASGGSSSSSSSSTATSGPPPAAS